MSFFRPLLRIIGLLVCALALGGCGALTRLTYNKADDVAYWWLDGYVDFSPAQSPRVRDDLAALLQWHRRTQLPQYAELMRKLQPLASQSVSAAQACAVADEVRGKLMAIGPQIEPAAARLAAGMTTQQFDHLQRKYDKVNAEFDRDWRSLTPTELRKKRIKQSRTRYEMLYGGLDAAQLEVIAADVDQTPFNLEAAQADRQRRHQDLLQTLRRIASDKPPPAEAEALIRGLLERSLDSPNPAYRALAQAQWQAGCENFARVHQSATPAQRARAVQTLRGYEADFRVLAAQ